MTNITIFLIFPNKKRALLLAEPFFFRKRDYAALTNDRPNQTNNNPSNKLNPTYNPK